MLAPCLLGRLLRCGRALLVGHLLRGERFLVLLLALFGRNSCGLTVRPQEDCVRHGRRSATDDPSLCPPVTVMDHAELREWRSQGAGRASKNASWQAWFSWSYARHVGRHGRRRCLVDQYWSLPAPGLKSSDPEGKRHRDPA